MNTGRVIRIKNRRTLKPGGYYLLTYIVGFFFLSVTYLGHFVWLFLILMVIIHVKGIAIRYDEVRHRYVHLNTILFALVLAYVCITGRVYVIDSFSLLSVLREFNPIWKDVLDWEKAVGHVLAFLVCFFLDYVTSFRLEGGVVGVRNLVVDGLKGVLCAGFFVNIYYISFIIFLSALLVDLVKSRKMTHCVIGGAGLYDGLIVEPVVVFFAFYVYLNCFVLSAYK